MANALTPQDVYQIVNEVAAQATGREDLAVVDTSSFVSVGETLLRTGAENTLNAISTVLSRTIFSVRPYKQKLSSLINSNDRWGAMVRKVVYLPDGAEQSQDWNTQLAPNALADGNSVDMFKINKPKAVQLNFYGTKLLQKHITRFRDQLSLAFSNEAEFAAFIDGVMTEFANDLETLHESETRLTMLNFIAGISSMGLTEVDLTHEYNIKNGTTLTRDQLLSEAHLAGFMQFVAATIKTYSSKLTDRTNMYHANLTNAEILRHTPKEKQRMIMYEPLFIDTQATVYSAIFNPKYLEIGDYEGVNFWQDPKTPEAIHVLPNILDVATGESKTAETEIELDNVIGILYDVDAMGVNFQFDYASTTPFNSAGGYYNMFIHERKNYWNDFTENAILFVMGAGGAE